MCLDAMWRLVLAALLVVAAAAQMPGGFSTISVNDAGALDALKFAVAQFNKGNGCYFSQVKNVVSVQRQVVDGYKYVITVNMARITLRKGGPTKGCPVHINPTTTRCIFTVWSPPGIKSQQVLKAQC